MTRERISRILELREILLSFETGFSLVNAAVVCAILLYLAEKDPRISQPRPNFWVAETTRAVDNENRQDNMKKRGKITD